MEYEMDYVAEAAARLTEVRAEKDRAEEQKKEATAELSAELKRVRNVFKVQLDELEKLDKALTDTIIKEDATARSARLMDIQEEVASLRAKGAYELADEMERAAGNESKLVVPGFSIADKVRLDYDVQLLAEQVGRGVVPVDVLKVNEVALKKYVKEEGAPEGVEVYVEKYLRRVSK